ncbi:Wzz/FepE/Etk N-terminal domain-containing protein [Pleomorphovibrio marinus]|uniref:Wzz/FepE/Etk N-terminal domain-containing protein n=1 Tax=Pleomorphovibrio marinus TaxID=2164132 RepID=UPI000E0B6BAE|nr:Wzz/FepE/Etk N-terminal domain-containing protein [Pleomorphovibrio marinus]
MPTQPHIVDDKITFRELILRLKGWGVVFWDKKRLILLLTIVGIVLGILASLLKKPKYVAETTFVLEESDMGGLSNLSGLASMIGLNLPSLGSESGLFTGDNIMELYRSQRMISSTLLSPMGQEAQEELLIDRYIAFNNLKKKWKNKVDLATMDFTLTRDSFSVKQDSVIREIVKEIRKENLGVEKPDRKLNILKISITSKDETFSKVFNETLVEKVNQFYKETKTKKTAENLKILQSQADSVRRVLDESLEGLARFQDRIPNPNPLLQQGTVESKSRQVDVQAAGAVYQEVVKNLEISKINHRNNTPLIQIIDSPRFPLEEHKIKLKTGIAAGGALFFILALFYVYASTLYRRNFPKS